MNYEEVLGTRTLEKGVVVINLSRPKIVYLEEWKEQELFLDRLDKAY